MAQNQYFLLNHLENGKMRAILRKTKEEIVYDTNTTAGMGFDGGIQ